MDNIILDEFHIYRMGNKIIPSVSEILQYAGLTILPYMDGDVFYQAIEEGLLDVAKWGVPSKIPVANMKNAQTFGKNTHLMCEYSDNNILKIETVDDNIKPLLLHWNNFLSAFKVRILDIEKIVYSEKYGFCGTVDRIVVINGKKYIIDLKTTSVIQPSAGIQLEAYNIALGGGYKKMVVQLKAGKYALKEFKEPTDKTVFLSALQIYNWKLQNGKIKRGI